MANGLQRQVNQARWRTMMLAFCSFGMICMVRLFL